MLVGDGVRAPRPTEKNATYARGVRIATPVCALARNDRVWKCGGRPQGSPLRRDRGAVRAGRRGRRPLRRATRREYGLPRQSADWLAMTGFDNKIKRRTSKRPPFCIKLREKSEVLDDLHDLGADALLSLHGGGADVSGRLENVPVAHF